MKRIYARFCRLADRLQDPLLLLVRLYWGTMFLVIGAGKLSDVGGTAGFFATLGIPLPTLSALLAGVTEAVGGLLLLLGAGARAAAVPLAVTMLVAYATAHRAEPFMQAKPFLYLVACLLVLAFGPGRLSLDARWRAADDPAPDAPTGAAEAADEPQADT